MARFIKFASLLLSASIIVVGCGDDDDSNSTPPATKCKSPYAGATEAQLKAATTSGACQGDTEAICKNDMITLAATCGVSCVQTSSDALEQAACTQSCMKMNAEPDPSDACLTCYMLSVQCAATNCFAECAADGNTPTCQSCRVEKGCTDAFYTCSGLPEPTADGGV
ncbi:MAG TPA: hypothetical protein VFQ61_10485 [Polyangiaceae bacterium]|nr:hypothetical protein [Polyangiaceae bacterium]